MLKKKILVLTDHMPWGHRSIAKAIYNYFEANKGTDLEVKYIEAKMPFDTLNDVYTFVYRYLPGTNRLATRAMGNQTLRDLFVELNNFGLPELQKLINWYKPDLVISAYFMYSHILSKWKQDQNLKFKLWTVVADPWSINPVSFVPGADLHLVYDEIGIKKGMRYGIDRDKMMATGWWVRPEMYDSKYKDENQRKKIKRWLGFNDDRPIVFVGGGSLGTNSLSRLLPVLLLVKRKVGIIFNTGTDKLSYNLVEEYNRLFRKMRRNDLVIIKNLGWIENMAEILSVADIVFGKAGPNFLFDVIACEKPMVAITHIGGQEDGNIDIIRKKKLGWVKEKGGHAGQFLLNYLNNPQKFLDKYKKTIKAEATNNRDSLKKILEMAREQ